MKSHPKPEPDFDWNERVRKLFGSLSHKYDLGNALISFGLHMRWKKELLLESGKLERGCRILDGATGTGDIAILAKKLCPSAHVIGVDFSPEMIEVARKRANRLLKSDTVDFRIGDLQSLDGFQDGCVDLYTIGFGLRNAEDRTSALSEMRRVLAADGVLAILDLAKPMPNPIRPLAWIFLRCVMPVFSLLFTGKPTLYLWLAKSLSNYPDYEVLKSELEGLGFTDVKRRLFGLGVVAAVSGCIPEKFV